MSGSYDRPSGRGGLPAVNPAAGYEPFDDVVTGPPTTTTPLPRHPDELRPPLGTPTHATSPSPLTDSETTLHRYSGSDPQPSPLSGRGDFSERARAPIVPADSVMGSSLTLVISIMCFFACLTAGTVHMMHQTAEAWLKDIASEITVQVEPRSNVDTEATLREVASFLESQKGVRAVRVLSLGDSSTLLEPWLGSSDVMRALPIPRLVALELDLNTPPELDAIRTRLTEKFKGVTLDDHRQWQRQIRTVTRSFALGGVAILLLVAAATTAIIVSATRSALASNREIVEVLHLVGATDRFIAREFEKHFLRLGVRAGLIGAVSAMGVFVLLPSLLELLGGGTVTLTEIHRLIGVGTLDPPGFVLLGILVVVVAALCMLTSRFGVFRILNNKG